MLSSWVPAELPGNQGAPIIAVYYSSHFPDSHIKQPSNPDDPPQVRVSMPTQTLLVWLWRCVDCWVTG